MLNILLVEDDKDLNFLISTCLKNAGYNVVSTYNGLDAISRFNEEKFDVVLSDIMMPLCDGYELARQIREMNTEVHIVFMSARDDKFSKQLGYKVGVDDYISKPFDVDELIMKMTALDRRLNISQKKEIVIGNLKMNQDEHVAYVDEAELPLTAREFDILYCMLSYPKKTFTRGKLMEDFWDFDSSATSRTVDVCVAKLREKTRICNGFKILTVHGLGYKVVLE